MIFVICRKVGDKYGKKLMDTAIKTGIDAAKIAKATGDLIRNKTPYKITSKSKEKKKKKKKSTYHQKKNSELFMT